MLPMRPLLILSTLLTFASVVAAQSSQPCAQFSVESLKKVDPGVAVVFTVQVNNLLPSEGLKYRWQVSVGTIMSGQNSPVIAVDTAGLGGQALEATVEVVGRESTCSIKSNPVAITAPPINCGLKFDEYGDIKWEDEKARLDNFAIQIMNIPFSRGALITFAGNPTYKGEAAFRLRRATDYLVNIRKVLRERLITTDAGYRTELITQLYVLPSDATVPAPDPYGLLPLSEVRFTKPKPNLNRRSPSRRRK